VHGPGHHGGADDGLRDTVPAQRVPIQRDLATGLEQLLVEDPEAGLVRLAIPKGRDHPVEPRQRIVAQIQWHLHGAMAADLHN
jgi:hypothetical protein